MKRIYFFECYSLLPSCFFLHLKLHAHNLKCNTFPVIQNIIKQISVVPCIFNSFFNQVNSSDLPQKWIPQAGLKKKITIIRVCRFQRYITTTYNALRATKLVEQNNVMLEHIFISKLYAHRIYNWIKSQNSCNCNQIKTFITFYHLSTSASDCSKPCSYSNDYANINTMRHFWVNLICIKSLYPWTLLLK